MLLFCGILRVLDVNANTLPEINPYYFRTQFLQFGF